MLIILFFTLFLHSVASFPLSDEVPVLDQLPFLSSLYSGYLPVPSGRLHYLAVLSPSASAPVLIWLNGGPGCSSLLGFGLENGPYIMDSPGNDNFKPNPWSWTKNVTLVYLEAPAGVGFSECLIDKCEYNDSSMALEVETAIGELFLKFPEL